MVNRTYSADVHKLNGTYRKHRHEKADKEGVIDISKDYPLMPEYLQYDEYAVYVWDRVKEVMEKSEIYTEADSGKLARYCVLTSEFEQSVIRRAEYFENKGGDFDEDGDVNILPTHFMFSTQKLNALRLLERDLYLDPEMRAKVGTKKNKAKNPFSELL